MNTKIALLATIATIGAAASAMPAMAQDADSADSAEDVVDVSGTLRTRYETVSQASQANDADAVTVRGRLGLSVKQGGFTIMAEGEGTFALVDDFNDTIPGNGIEPFPVVADPNSIELNRAFISYAQGGNSVKVGRQRIIHANSRFVGNVGWRQNEQTFDAVRAQGSIGPVSLDSTYSISQRTIFGSESPNGFFDGDFILLLADADLDVIDLAAFAYDLDYDTRVAFSSESFGVTGKLALSVSSLSPSISLGYATQSDTGGNPVDYTAQWLYGEVGASVAGFNVAIGYEELGSDDGIAAFQTPLATLHAFNGWADLFLVTPAAGLRDYYGRVSRRFSVPGLATFNAAVIYHEFDSDFGGLDYGSEINASLGFKVGPAGILLKYADFDSEGFGADKQVFWLQADFNF